MPDVAMSDLNSRANFQTFAIDGTPIVLYEDHRSLLFALWHAKRCGLLNVPHTLITFDLHDDARPPAAAARQRSLDFRDGKGDERDFFSFVEWDLSPLDDDWLTIAFDLNLVGDVVNIGAVHHDNLPNFETSICDELGEDHRVWRVSHLWDSLGPRGALGDHVRRAELEGLWGALCWNARSQTVHQDARVILDFDLDCFSMVGPAGTIAWPADAMSNLFGRPIPPTFRTGAQVLEQFFAASSMVTIARESPFCGGTEESQAILHTLDEIVFQGRLLSR